MKMPYIARLQVAVTHECAICHDITSLEYVMSDDQSNVMSICERCRDDVIRSLAIMDDTDKAGGN